MTLTTPTRTRAVPTTAPQPTPADTRHHATITTAQLAQLSGTSVADVQDLVDYGVLSPTDPDSRDWAFALPDVQVLQRAEALRRDLALDTHAFALAVMLLKQITALEWQLHAAEADIAALKTAC